MGARHLIGLEEQVRRVRITTNDKARLREDLGADELSVTKDENLDDRVVPYAQGRSSAVWSNTDLMMSGRNRRWRLTKLWIPIS